MQQQNNKNKILIDHNKNEIYGWSNSYQFKDVFNKTNSKNDYVFNIKLSHNNNNIVNIKNSANVNTSANINNDNRK